VNGKLLLKFLNALNVSLCFQNILRAAGKYDGMENGVFSQPDSLALGAVADFGAQNCQYTTKVDARQNV